MFYDPWEAPTSSEHPDRAKLNLCTSAMQRELVPAVVQRTRFAYFYESSIVLCGVVNHNPAGNRQMAQDASKIMQKFCTKTFNTITGLYSTQTNGRFPRK
jgi:hypothetical protein